jgi:hypothetical protein
MSALPDTVVPFALPAKQPKIKEHEPTPDQRKLAVIPIRACTDKQMTHGMIRALLLICSYINRAGITWVSQAKLASQMGVTQQAVSKHLVKLTKAGYLEVIRKPIPGQRHATWRVIFDPSLTAEDAVAITSAQEDTRPPYMRKEQEDQTPDPDGQRRIAQLIAKALRQPPTKQEPTMPKPGESVTVKKMKQEIAAHKKKTQLQPPEVVQPPEPHIQPLEVVQPTTSEGCEERKKTCFKEVIRLLYNQKVEMNEKQIQESMDFLWPIYQAEGLTPAPSLLAESILQMHRDTA